MEYKVKRISTAGIAEAISKAELYRSLNEPEEAESICRDILTIEPQHQLALRLLGLALTDQFTGRGSDRYRETEGIFRQLQDPYERLYYIGILQERRAKAQLNAGQQPHTLVALFDQALKSFAEAEKMSAMLAECSAGPMTFRERFRLMTQGIVENDAHLTYLGSKSLLFNAARLGYGVLN